MKRCLFFLLAMALTGCAAGAAKTVRARAAFDLSCTEESVVVNAGGGCNWFARGCGKKAAYVVKPMAEGSWSCCPPIGCTAVLNGPIHEETQP